MERAQEEELSKNGNRPPVGGVLRAEFRDSDHLASTLVSWDLSLMQLEAGAFRGELFQVLLPGSMMLNCTMSRGVSQQGSLPPGMRTFGIPMKGCAPFVWRGHEVADDVMMIFPRGGELDSRSTSRFMVTTLSVREDLLEKLAERESMEWILKEQGRVVRPAPQKLEQLRVMATSLLARAVSDHESVFVQAFRHEVEEELARMALEVLADGHVQQKRPMAQERSRILRVALDHIEQHLREPVQVAELVEQAGCSARTLRYAFEEKFGVPPKMYLQTRRLAELRRKLRLADRQQTVSSVAACMGFTHMGQLAGDYRRMFGELPSKTLLR